MMIREIREKNPTFFKEIKNMPLRARVGRNNEEFDKGTICFIRDKKRDSFIFVKKDAEFEELTFLETVKRFEALENEKGIDLHKLHHQQVQVGLQVFSEKVEEEKARDKKVDTTQGPNEKRAISYLDAMINLPFTNEAERDLIVLAKEAVRKGKFQNLQRDINKLQKAVKKSPLKPVIILERIIAILKSYPLKQEEEDIVEKKAVVIPKSFNPEIIISESFSK